MSAVRYSTGDLPSTRASSSAGSSVAARCSTAGHGSHATWTTVRVGHRGEEIHVARPPLRLPRTLEQQMVQHERKVERRVAVPRAFGVQHDRTVGADQQVLGAEVAMDEHAFGGGGAVGERGESGGEIGVRAAGGDQVRIEADRPNRASVANRAATSGRPAVAPWSRPSTSPTPAPVFASITPSRARPSRPDNGRAVAIPSRTRRPAGSSASNRGTFPGTIEPASRNHSASYALRSTGSVPIGRDLQFRQGTFDAKRLSFDIDAIDLRRDTTGQRRCARTVNVSAHCRRLPQNDVHPGRRRDWHGRLRMPFGGCHRRAIQLRNATCITFGPGPKNPCASG